MGPTEKDPEYRKEKKKWVEKMCLYEGAPNSGVCGMISENRDPPQGSKTMR